MSSIPIKQDLPPSEGYGKIQWERNPCKKYFSAPIAIAAYLAVTIGGYYVFHLTKKEVRAARHELQSANSAILPFFLAEYDRSFLKEARKNRDIEAELMKNVPGWTVGTYYGRQRYMTQKDDQWVSPGVYEFYAHCHPDDLYQKQTLRHWS